MKVALAERGKIDRVNLVFHAMLKEPDSAVGVMAIKYQYSWLISRSNSNVSILELDSSLRTSTYFPCCAYRNFQLATQAQAPHQFTRFLVRQGRGLDFSKLSHKTGGLLVYVHRR